MKNEMWRCNEFNDLPPMLKQSALGNYFILMLNTSILSACQGIAMVDDTIIWNKASAFLQEIL